MNWRRLGPIIAATVGMMLSTAPIAQAANPVLPPQSKPFGHTYAVWSAAWWQWSLSIPVHKNGSVNHPLVEDPTGATNTRCAVGQEVQKGSNQGQFGEVWFLGGEIVQSGTSALKTVNRTCTIPHGKALFFPVINGECSMLEGEAYACPGSTIASLRADVACVIAKASNLTAQLDGSSLPIGSDFRVQSPSFRFTLPADDILTYQGEGPYTAGNSSGPSVGDGYYVMLAPLSSGRHTLHFHGEIHARPPDTCPATGFDFILDVTYHLSVS